MKTLTEIKTTLQQLKPQIQKRYRITELGIFCSYARGEEHQESNIDVLIDYLRYLQYLSLLDAANLEFSLDKQFGMKVDVVSKKGLKTHLRERILAEVIYI